jgi:trk system potassium uptake protein TrkH
MKSRATKPTLSPATALPVPGAKSGLVLSVTLLWAYAILLIAGYVVFQTPGTLIRGNEMSHERAALVVINAATLTGFQLNLAIDQYHLPGQLMILILTVGGTVFSLIVGGIAVTRVVRLPYQTRQIVLTAIGIEVIGTAAGAIALYQKEQPVLACILQAASALGNSGVWMGAREGPLAWRVHLVLLPLAIVGGLGIPVVIELWRMITRRQWLSAHSVAVLWTMAAIYVVGVGAVFLLQRRLAPSNSASQLNLLAASSAAVINARTAGLPIQVTAPLARNTAWILMLLMAVGAASGGSAGGIKSTTLLVCIRGAYAAFIGKNPGRIFAIALTWVAAYFSLVLITFLLLLQSEPDLEADRLLFIVISAASNVGLSHERLSIAGGGQITLCAAMLLGRLLPLCLLWWTALTVRDADVAVA